MSHIPQRKEKDCLNCGSIVQGRFCQHCGQENVVPKETFWHMVTHFFYDIIHFDSQFFHTIHHLVLKPGFLSREYIKGKRASYLHPIKMYVFTSAIFFLLFFTFFKPEIKDTTDLNQPLSAAERAAYTERLQKALETDSADREKKEALRQARDSSRVIRIKDMIRMEGTPVLSFSERGYNSREEYDSIQRVLPAGERDGWLRRRLERKAIDLNRAYEQDPKGTTNKLVNTVLHQIPYMLFVSLPLFALILKLVYRRRKQFYFADHGVFTIHLYVFTFLLLLLVFLLGEAETLSGWSVFEYLAGGLVLLLFLYLYKAMRLFYGQGRMKTLLKFGLVSLVSGIMMLFLFLAFMVFSAVTF